MVYFGYAQDSIPKYKERYSIRFGIDMSKPIRSMIENDYKGLELTADYRITKKLYKQIIRTCTHILEKCKNDSPPKMLMINT